MLPANNHGLFEQAFDTFKAFDNLCRLQGTYPWPAQMQAFLQE